MPFKMGLQKVLGTDRIWSTGRLGCCNLCKKAKDESSSEVDGERQSEMEGGGGGDVKLSKVRIICMAASIGGAYMVWGLIISLLPPFYPKEAELKGATPSQYGFVFGCANLAAFIFAPIFGRVGHKIGAKLLYNFGAYLQALSAIALGLLYYIEDVNLFIGLSYMLRIFGGIADAAAWSAVLGILMSLFPSKVARIISFTQMFFGVGYMMGPAIGALLYEAGGFLLPFEVVGGLGIVMATCLLIFIPNVQSSNAKGMVEVAPAEGKVLTYKEIVMSPSIWVPLLDNVICFFGNGCIMAMMEPHLEEIGADTSTVGFTFLLFGLVFAISTPLTGAICERIPYVTIVSLAGNVILAIVLSLIGPLPFIPLEPSVKLIQVLMGLVGLGFACVMVSTFGRAQTAPIRLGYQKDLATYMLISGLWSGTLYLGGFLGPTIAGFLVDAYGFRSTTILYWALYLVAIVIDACDLGYNVKMGNNKKSLEYQKL